MSRVQEIERKGAVESRWALFAQYELPWLACMALITALSSQPALPGPGERGSVIRDIFNYGGHIFMFGLLAGLTWRVLVHRAASLPAWLVAHPRLSAGLFALLYGIGDEFYQSFIPGRTASVWDVVADGFGALLFMLAIGLWQRSLRAGD
jgi:hypothetical protein